MKHKYDVLSSLERKRLNEGSKNVTYSLRCRKCGHLAIVNPPKTGCTGKDRPGRGKTKPRPGMEA